MESRENSHAARLSRGSVADLAFAKKYIVVENPVKSAMGAGFGKSQQNAL
jgi:hypothetical protein